MNKLTQFTAVALLSVASLSANANPVELKVIGVIKPASCTAGLTGGGEVNYGNISAGRLSDTDFTALESRAVAFELRCGSSTKLAIKAVDNRRNSVVEGAAGTQAAIGTLFGLGQAGDKNIGAYTLRMAAATVTGAGQAASAAILQSTDGQLTWQRVDGAGAFGNNRSLSWTDTNADAPGEYTLVSGNIDVQAFLNKRGELPVNQDIPLDGTASLELVYL